MPPRTDRIIEQKICKLYTNGYGTCELSRQFGISITTLSKILDRNNVVKYKGKKPSNKYKINFFSSYSDEACYWAGFIYADGCVTDQYGVHKVHIGLKNSDENHLVKFVQAIGFTGKIYNDNYNDAKVLAISGRWFVEDLAKNFNITPQKSLTIEFPKQLPIDKLSHFIRGIFDGDGSITQNIDDKGAVSLLGTLSTIENVVNCFHDIVGVKINHYGSNNSGKPAIQKIDNIYSIRYHNYNAKMILDWLYDESTQRIRLDRKYHRYLEYFTEDKISDKRLKKQT